MRKRRKQFDERFSERRVVFLSFLSDDKFAVPCCTSFRERLKPIPKDDYGVPLELRSSDELLKAGDVKAIVEEKLHDVTDVVAFLSSPYLGGNEKAKAGEFAFFVSRKLDQEAAGGDGQPLIFWLAPVESRLRLRRYKVNGRSLGDEPYQRWWHPFFKSEEQRFSVEQDLAAKLSDEVAKAGDQLLEHTQGRCPKCKNTVAGGKNE